MKVLQIIDSLNAGGAERMAVNYANALQERGIESFLCCTREEGLLKSSIKNGVGYIFLNKKSTLDVKAIFKLKKYIKQQGITHLHAHGTSFFTATLQKLFASKLKLVWHDHHGNRPEQSVSSNRVLYWCSYVFDAIICVNPHLSKWNQEHLSTKKVFYIPNFVNSSQAEPKRNLKETKHIVCVANLRNPKNHMNLLGAFEIVLSNFSQTQLHLIGKDYNDAYSSELKHFLKLKNIEQKVIFHGEKDNVRELIKNMDLGVLSSNSEGLPMALLEYGMATLPIVSTNVGQCAEVVQNYSKIVEPSDKIAFANAVISYFEKSEQMKTDAINFHQHVEKNYTEKAVLPQIIDIYRNL